MGASRMKQAHAMNIKLHSENSKSTKLQFQARTICLACLLTIALFFCGASAESVKAPQDADARHAESDSYIDDLALKLSDESYELREQATADLWKLGAEALPTLRRVALSDDIEASDRAEELIRYISAGLLFDSPQEAKELVMKFFESTYNGKILITHKLIEIGQWKQVMHLSRLDGDPDVQRVMAEVSWPHVQAALRNAIAGGDEQQVAEIMGLMGDTDLHMRTRAFHVIQRGQLALELKKSADTKGQVAARWRMWLHRCNGDLKAAIAEAEKAGMSRTTDLLRVLDGDASQWLKSSAAEGDAIYQWGCKLQQLKIEGKDAEAKLESENWRGIEAGQAKLSFVIRCLAVNGFREQALNLLESSNSNAAFYYYDVAEMPSRSLKVLGIEKHAKPPYTEWVGKRIGELKEGWSGRDEAAQQVMMLAGFLYGRGESQHAVDVLSPMMSLLDEQDKGWSDQVEAMLKGGMAPLGVHFIKQKIEQGGANQAQLTEIVEKMIGHMERSMRDCIWTHLTKRNGDDHGASLDQLGFLAGLLSDPDDQASKIHNGLLRELGEDEMIANNQEVLLIDTLYKLCIARNDLNAASQMMDAYLDRSSVIQLSRDDINYNLLRWEKVEPVLAAGAVRRPLDRGNLIKWYVALQKLGRHENAEEVFSRVMQLCLGDPDSLTDYGQYLYAVGYEHQAIELWTLAAMIADFDDEDLDDYVWAVTLLASNSRSLYARGEWQKAWSISEVFARFIMLRSSVHTHDALKACYQTEFCHGMMMLKQGRYVEGMRRLETARQMIPGDGVLADDFFPALRDEIPTKTYNEWFDDCYDHITKVCKDYPRSHNVHNTAAWLASRAVRYLDEAHANAQIAVSMRPNQGAYLDTMAEVWFAKGDREKALLWSEKAIAGSISNAAGSPRSLRMVYANYQQLSKQYQHFKNDPLPTRAR